MFRHPTGGWWIKNWISCFLREKKISCLNNYFEVQVTVPFQFFRYFRKQIYSHFQISFFSKNPYLKFSDFNFSIFPKTNIFTFSDFIFFEKSVFKFFRFHFFENPKINIFKFSDFIFFENPYLHFQISIFFENPYLNCQWKIEI